MIDQDFNQLPASDKMNAIENIVNDLLNSRKIQAIKDVRVVTNLGLKEAKDVADRVHSPGLSREQVTRRLVNEFVNLGYTMPDGHEVVDNVNFDGAEWVDPSDRIIARATLAAMEKMVALLTENNHLLKDLLDNMED